MIIFHITKLPSHCIFYPPAAIFYSAGYDIFQSVWCHSTGKLLFEDYVDEADRDLKIAIFLMMMIPVNVVIF